MQARGTPGTARWIAGSPWRDMRLRARLEPEGGLLVAPVDGVTICGRHPEWLLTEEGLGGLLLPVLREELGRLPAGSRRIRISEAFQGGEPYVRIVCLDRALEGVFLRFCESVLEELAQVAAAPEGIARALERFRRLFEHADSGASGERIIGLMAELAVLEWLLGEGVDAVRGWSGPFGAVHDFVFGPVHLEVKALPATGERRFQASSIYQLQEPDGGRLYLVGLRVGPGGEAVGERYERVRRCVPPERVAELDRAMVAAGCPVPVEESWNARRFTVGEPEAWAVGEGFPRLVPRLLADGRVPEGVLDVRYTASLEAAREHLVARAKVVEAVRTAEMEDT